MSKVFAINAGSSSLKFSIYEVPEETVIASGLVERIGIDNGVITIKYQGEKVQETLDIPDHEVATSHLLDKLKELKIIESFDEIAGSGHRIVAGGGKTCRICSSAQSCRGQSDPGLPKSFTWEANCRRFWYFFPHLHAKKSIPLLRTA